MRLSANTYVALLAVSAIVYGLVVGLLIGDEDSIRAAGVAYGVVILVLLFGWCKAHVREAGIKEPSLSAVMCAFFNVIGVVTYFYRGFGAKEGTKKTFKALLVLIVMLALYVGATMIAEVTRGDNEISLQELQTSSILTALTFRPLYPPTKRHSVTS